MLTVTEIRQYPHQDVEEIAAMFQSGENTEQETIIRLQDTYNLHNRAQWQGEAVVISVTRDELVVSVKGLGVLSVWHRYSNAPFTVGDWVLLEMRLDGMAYDIIRHTYQQNKF